MVQYLPFPVREEKDTLREERAKERDVVVQELADMLAQCELSPSSRSSFVVHDHEGLVLPSSDSCRLGCLILTQCGIDHSSWPLVVGQKQTSSKPNDNCTYLELETASFLLTLSKRDSASFLRARELTNSSTPDWPDSQTPLRG